VQSSLLFTLVSSVDLCLRIGKTSTGTNLLKEKLLLFVLSVQSYQFQ
jgi:hypothetical protein